MSGHRPFRELKDMVRHRQISDARVLAKEVMEEHVEYEHMIKNGPLYKLAKAFLLLDWQLDEKNAKIEELEKVLSHLHAEAVGGCCGGPG